MYQTYSSVEKDAPSSMSAKPRKVLHTSTWRWNNLDAVLAAMKDVKIVMPVRTAFYGMKEFAVQDPAAISSPCPACRRGPALGCIPAAASASIY